MKKHKLPPLEEEERIYFKIPYMDNGLAKCTHCGFDPDKKLWFTGCHNSYIQILVNKYGVNQNTTEKAMKLLEEALSKNKK